MAGARATDGDTLTTARLLLRALPLPSLDALLLGRREEVERWGGFSLPDRWPLPGDTGFLLERRAALAGAGGAGGRYLLRAVVMRGAPSLLVGHAGFHGPPDAAGRLELAYEVLPHFRGRGYAREAVEALLAWAAGQPGVAGFRASVAPDNAPSVRLVQRLGFTRTGEAPRVPGEELWGQAPQGGRASAR
jgi:RimJ/RimL family protein N-acetyltransferase